MKTNRYKHKPQARQDFGTRAKVRMCCTRCISEANSDSSTLQLVSKVKCEITCIAT